jgi:hypothetical protein
MIGLWSIWNFDLIVPPLIACPRCWLLKMWLVEQGVTTINKFKKTWSSWPQLVLDAIHNAMNVNHTSHGQHGELGQKLWIYEELS